MVLHPEVMKHGQEELDRVVGKNNLPTFDDRPNLPYIEAILKECLRYNLILLISAYSTDRGHLIFKGGRLLVLLVRLIQYDHIWASS